MTFKKNKNAKQLGIDTTRKFRVVDDRGHCFDKGDILIVERDEDDCVTYMKRISDNEIEPCAWYRLEYAEKDLETLEVGDLVVNGGGGYRRILDVGTRNGESTVYELSKYDNNINHDDLKKHGLTFTAFELKAYEYTPYTPEEKEEEVTITISKKSLEALKESGIKIKE